jgi:presenilin-like A22 family membrane protease
MTPTEHRSITAHGLIVFAATAALTLAGVSLVSERGGYAPSEPVSAPFFLALFFLMTLVLLAVLKITKQGAVFEALFTLAMLSGAWFLADIFLPGPLALVAGSIVIMIRFAWKNALISNASMAVGIAGISASIASSLTVNAALIVLTALAFYDIVAVYATGHMIRMFRDLASRGAVYAFLLVPLRAKDLLRPTVSAADDRVLYLGTGDVALPMLLLSATTRVGRPAHGLGVALGAAAGFCLMSWLFYRQGRRRPMPALPPIALGSILGYFLSLLTSPL